MADITSHDRPRVVAQMPRRRVDLEQLEQDIAALPAAESAPELPHMTANDILKQHEAVALAVESLGEEVKVSAVDLQASIDECGATMRLLADAATQIRERGKHRAIQSQEVNAQLKEIREMVAAFKEKVGG